jgi:hypothetical protein
MTYIYIYTIYDIYIHSIYAYRFNHVQMGLYSSGPMTNMCGRLNEPLARLFPDPPAR